MNSTSTKAPWVVLPDGVPAVPECYDCVIYLPEKSLQRAVAILERMQSF